MRTALTGTVTLVAAVSRAVAVGRAVRVGRASLAEPFVWADRWCGHLGGQRGRLSGAEGAFLARSWSIAAGIAGPSITVGGSR